ncbi:LysR family transcriptional regulator [Elioraea sp.]|uniref:LysR family transcriptional regulator n=1 Tax=Elioraea sp. TaxID=2185103 RepID=UPI0025BD8615|nr:LysR family transcriptional regulator [Elioraea sp.]
MDLRDLHLVRAIDEHGSLVRAARALGTSQPSLTRGLAALEARLKGPLFTRTARGAIATDLGRAFLADAAEVLARMGDMQRHLAEVRGGQVRDLVVVGGHYAMETIGLVAAARMLAAFPAIRIRADSMTWTGLQGALLSREAQLCIGDLRGIKLDPALEVERLAPLPGVFVARPGHALAGRTSVTLSEILAYPLITIGQLPREVQAPLATAREAARAAGSLHPAFPAFVQEGPTVAMALLDQCDAVAPVPIALAARRLGRGDVVALPFREPWLSVHPGIIQLRGRRPSEEEGHFLDLLRAASAEADAVAAAWCARLGLPAACG